MLAPVHADVLLGPRHDLLATPAQTPSHTSSSTSAYSWLQRQLATGKDRQLAGVARGRGEKGGKIGGAEFFRKDGVVGDMDGYLNYLSLEYD